MSNSGEETEASYEQQCYDKVEKASEALNIFKVPNKLRKVEDAYSPRLVSIGIYHREKHELAAMQEHKYRYRRFFEKRLNESAASLERFEDFFVYSSSGNKIHSSYVGNMSTRYKSYDIISTTSVSDIVLDGFFILELFLRYYEHYNLNMRLEEQSDDPIFNTTWIIPALRQDLALVENQIPFFILQTLFEAITPHLKASVKPAPNSLTSLALHFFEPAAMKNQKAIIKGVDDPPGGTEGYKHLLDLLHKFYLQSQPKSTENKQHPVGAGDSSIIIPNIDIPASGSYNNWGFNFCASQLLESGIEIERQSSENHLLNITFSKGVIRIPSLFIDDNISLLRNLIAYEQCTISSNHITSYPILLKSLIRSSKDIKILRQRRIINSNWIDDEVYLAQCHSILDEVVVKDFCFADLCNQVNAYARKFWFRRRLKSLYRTYFSTAWSLISFIAALCLFVLTVIQTYYAIHHR